MTDIETVVNGLNDIGGFIAGRVGIAQARNFLRTIDDALALLKDYDTQLQYRDDHIAMYQAEIQRLEALLKEQKKIKSQEEFSKIIHGMFDHLWDCEIEHPIFQDTVGDLMNAVIQAYGQAVKWE